MSETISKTNITIIIILMLILALATYLRITHLPTNPAWYTDEGTHLSIAHHLLQGRVQYFAVTDSMLLFARPPLFHACLAVVSSIFGEGIATLRGFTAGLGVFSTLLVFIVVRLAMRHGRIYASLVRPYDAKNDEEAQDAQYIAPIGHSASKSPLSIKWGGDLGVGFALWVTFLYAVYPQAILYTRFGFSYALLTPMVILIAYFLMRHIQTGRWNPLAWAGILAGIGLLGDIMMGSIIAVVGLIALFKSPKMVLWLVPLMALPFGIYAGINLINHPSAFLFDLNFTLNRLGGIPITRQLNTIAENFTMLLSTDLWFPLGIAGIFLIRPLSLRVVSACLVLLPIVIIGRTVAMFHLSLYYMSPLFPLIILGIASITWGGGWIINSLMMMFREMRFIHPLPKQLHLFVAGIITCSLIGAPLFFIMQHTINGINTRIQTAIDPFLVDSADGEAIIHFFQSQNTDDTLILASPSIGWALELYTSANIADWQMHVAYIGYDAIHLPHNVPPERYAFIPTLDHADYVVIDAIWRNWGNVHIPQAVVLYHTIMTEWELVYHAGTLEVYARP